MDPFEGDSPKNYEELGDPVDGEPMVDPITGKKIVRPRNAWILYRNARLGHVERLPDGSAQPMAAASKIISKWWKAESKEVKNEYELLAEREKAEHKQKYPNYRFQPKSKVQKQREQAAKKEAKNKAKAANKKNRAASATMTSFSSSVHTSYVAAALANQHATQAPMFGPGSLSPPLSLASTPITSPSPLSSFDPEPSSSSTPATSFSSPFNTLDSGSFSSLDFSGQDAALSRVPQHVPPKLPPRIRGQVWTSSTAGPSTDTSSDLQLPSPAPTSAPGGSSPLPWPTTAPQYSPESQASSPPAVPMPSAAASPPPGPWIDESLYEAVPEDSAPVSVELGFPSNGIDFSQFGDYFDFDGLLGIDNADNGTIFQMPSENFLTSAPGQIDVSINCPQSVSGVTLEESTAFSEVLGSFDFPAFQEGSSMQLPSQYTSDGLMSRETWNFDASLTRLGSGLDLGMEHALVNGEDLLASYMTQDVLEEQPMIQDVIPVMEHPTPPPEPTQPTQLIAHSTVQPDPPQSSSLTVRLDEIPAFLRETPQFQAWLAGKVSNQPSTSQQPQSQDFNNSQQHQFFQPASFQQFSTQDMFSMQQQYTQSQPQQNFQQSLQLVQLAYDSSQYGQPVASHHSYSEPGAHVSSSVTPSDSVTPTPPANTYMPPSGAVHAGTRRVAGTWKPPVEPEPWSAPPTPADIFLLLFIIAIVSAVHISLSPRPPEISILDIWLSIHVPIPQISHINFSSQFFAFQRFYSPSPAIFMGIHHILLSLLALLRLVDAALVACLIRFLTSLPNPLPLSISMLTSPALISCGLFYALEVPWSVQPR